MKVFYSWQSDLESKFNRGFIKEALGKALKQLNNEIGIIDSDRPIELDHDTKNVPGTPDLANTIFQKISESSVFIADISFVSSNVNRKISNPNVLIELGYALSCKGSDKVLCIMNTAYGLTDELPFDLKHKRHPIQYCCQAESLDKKRQGETLVKTLVTAIRPIIDLERSTKEEISFGENPSAKNIFNAILTADSKDDWQVLQLDNSGSRRIAYLKRNTHLRLEINYIDDVHNDDFREKWANKYPDKHASSDWVSLYYGATLIKRFILVSVDGGRGTLPLPKSQIDLTVDLLNYKIAQIFDTLGTLNQYMVRSGLSVQNLDLDGGFGDGSGFGGGSALGEGSGDGTGQG